MEVTYAWGYLLTFSYLPNKRAYPAIYLTKNTTLPALIRLARSLNIQKKMHPARLLDLLILNIHPAR